MDEHIERVRLRLGDNLTGRLAAAVDAAHKMHARFERDAATWEPHDWTEWG